MIFGKTTDGTVRVLGADQALVDNDYRRLRALGVEFLDTYAVLPYQPELYTRLRKVAPTYDATKPLGVWDMITGPRFEGESERWADYRFGEYNWWVTTSGELRDGKVYPAVAQQGE